MPGEAAFDEGRRYLLEGRLLLKAVSDHHIAGIARGDSGVFHQVTGDATGFFCPCPTVTNSCSHLVALRLVTGHPLAVAGPGPKETR